MKIKSNAMHPPSGAFPLPYVPARVTHGALLAHSHSFTPPRCRTSQYRRTFLLLSVSLWSDLIVTMCLMVWDRWVLRAEPMLSCWLNLLFHFVSHYFSFFFLKSVGCVGWGLQIDRVFSLLPCLCTAESFLIILIIIKNDLVNDTLYF